MPLTYCSCITAGIQVVMGPDSSRPGRYICSGCGAPEEVVFSTSEAMQEQYTRTGLGVGNIPENLLMGATLLDDLPGIGPRITPFKDPSIETRTNSGRSLKEIEQMQKEIANG